MNRRAIAIRQFVAWGLAVFAALWVVGHCQACSAPMTPQEKALVASQTFGAEMLACVEKSDTIEASRACRADVRRRWGVDGGSR